MKLKKVLKWITAGAALTFLSIGLVGCGKQSSNYKPKKLTVGFTPSVNAGQANAEAKPLAKQLEKQLHIPVTVKVSTDGNSLVQAMGSKTLDVSEMNPGDFVLAQKNYQVAPLVQATRQARDSKTLQLTNKTSDHFYSTVVVRKDSGINNINDLKGKKIAIGTPNSTAGYVYPVVELMKHGININKDGIKTDVINGYDQAVLSVLNKNNDAAFTFQGAQTLVQKDDPNVMKDTKVIYTTKAIPNDVVATRSDMSKSWKNKIAKAYENMAKTKEGHDIIFKIYQEEGYVPYQKAQFKQLHSYMDQANKISKTKE
ncbi:phosphate/phosphite/phosphonate ABC transporter substrate-binding protein [Fructilactobacillus fructivorans]|uniref:ABC-type phosphate/phosphonate transport system, periplasmic component n=1 Tax=Fructilactobacillus fructivorans TaxID=1614 RepID=A0A0C1PRF4_9LACO|nr:phosphate/phosphite/phosphonate ABC transporter substrate-binding protein [Fructilactobacillus fructivorans]KID42461.1 ABC-type phosphate/phosphonate transport system, periplasmic component [Fructilactobacillus fructivorans]MCT0150927.1 phosphate/phosphite/phosphonate ABC transporter substrate-binding protein [Fructilactobacillus fructivorans]MCT2867516.1 phosphate/phosphite/phosphonate ABC transporter substrate-binding protein [Fructilactobacillus fructivorans]MCT2868966.1 phosphate/phosphi